ncbi:MAG: dihydroorotate dehydrogenase electron transfer subunit [Methanocalculus sp. MSAO_Arc2]|uniref:dihydroorotate dehydrogenase electron transfer subunit n=1 Tax=Methanocalculus sp. MSAO_Arc2 TaxID=2293855 RepID=UPI000FF7C3FC|nr:MAG: dihydroorotate dehydrogenase electron transfer subunit [Methanocalculus sp. MSAO_Arc2]
MRDGMPRIVMVRDVVHESGSVATLYFDHHFQIRPGQFCMVWVPGIDEVPMAFSSPASITVQRVGEATRALTSMAHPDQIGIRGPFGNGFSPQGRVLAIAGGFGVAPLLPLAKEGSVDTFILGARTLDDLIFTSPLDEHTDLLIATDDGSAGHHGFVTGVLDEQIDLCAFDTICVCGPELMMKAVLDRLDALEIADRGQFSLHRYMKCGIGVCGSCSIDPEGLRVCADGPVFPGNRLVDSELGRYARDASGQKKRT